MFMKLDQPTGDNVVTVDDLAELHSKVFSQWHSDIHK